MKKTVLLIILVLAFSLFGCGKEVDKTSSDSKTQTSSKIVSSKSQSNNTSSNSNLSSSISPVLGKLRQIPIAKSKDNFGFKDSGWWLTLSNERSACFDNQKTLYLINTKDLTVIKKFDLENIKNYTRLKKTNDGFVFLSTTNAYKFNLNMELLQKVSVKDISDISEDFKTILYEIRKDGVYISDINRSNPKLIAKSEKIADDTTGRSFRSPMFVDKEKKILFAGIGWEYVYAILVYDIEKSTIKRFTIAENYESSLSYEFGYFALDDKCILKGDNIDIINYVTMEKLRVNTEKLPLTMNFITNGLSIIYPYNGGQGGANDYKIKKYDFNIKKMEEISISKGWVDYTIISILPDNTIIIFDQKNFYRIKID